LRNSATSKIYRCQVDAACELSAEHLDVSHRPTLEQLSADPNEWRLPTLSKTLVLSTDDHPQISADLEGMVMLGADSLLLVNDNDFGVEGAETCFWRIAFDAPLSR
jgi:hypothetical protein